MSTTVTSMEDLLDRARALATSGRRAILGLVGAPGAGKSTVSRALVHELGPQVAVVVPMDGFHLANEVLRDQGLADVKGNISTFDAPGYAALLRRLQEQRDDEIVYAPRFDRTLEESIGSAIRIDPWISLVITEGNYLLCDGLAWERARAALTQSWFIQIPQDLRLRWLIDRHIAHGRSPQAAREWVTRSDEANARLVLRTADRADVLVNLPVGDLPEPTTG
ncbi:MAG: nucleoside/nucleotide kinase family protein [Micrococcales bacterium]|nr:nucleoside/nucleotide kinase family protein [Micrococcales bacterium]